MIYPYFIKPPGFTREGVCCRCSFIAWQLRRKRPFVEICGLTTGDADNHRQWWPVVKKLTVQKY